VSHKSLLGKSGPFILLIGISLGTLFFRIGALPFIGADECRYARIAQEMNQSKQWVTPLLQGYPWLEKPPLYYWITMPIFRWLGVSEMSARLGPALCALLAAASVLWLGWKLWSRLAGLLGGTILLTATGFCAYGRAASTDMPITACFTVAFAVLSAALLKEKTAFWKVGLAYVSLGLAVLAKGPVAVILAAGIVVLFWALDEQGDSLKKLHVVWGTVIAIAVAFPWFWLAFKENGFSFLSIFFINQNLARYLSDVHHHEAPIYYFLAILPGLLFPWSGWLPALLPSFPLRRSLDWRSWDRGALFLTCWAVFPVLFFSLSGSKLPGYILPSLPPVALLLGRRLADWVESRRHGSAQTAAAWCYLIFSIAVAVAFPIVLERNYGNAWRTGVWLGAAALLPALLAFCFARRRNYRAAIKTTAVQGVLLVLAVTLIGFPLLEAYDSTRGIAIQALTAGADGEPIVTFCYFHHTLNYYTNYRVGANFLDPPSLLDYARRHPRFLLVTERDRLNDLARISQLSATLLAQQGKVRLLRITLLRPKTALR